MHCTTFLDTRDEIDEILYGIDFYVRDMVVGNEQLHCIYSYNFDRVARDDKLGSVNIFDRGVLFVSTTASPPTFTSTPNCFKH